MEPLQALPISFAMHLNTLTFKLTLIAIDFLVFKILSKMNNSHFGSYFHKSVFLSSSFFKILSITPLRLPNVTAPHLGLILGMPLF